MVKQGRQFVAGRNKRAIPISIRFRHLSAPLRPHSSPCRSSNSLSSYSQPSHYPKTAAATPPAPQLLLEKLEAPQFPLAGRHSSIAHRSDSPEISSAQSSRPFLR